MSHLEPSRAQLSLFSFAKSFATQAPILSQASELSILSWAPELQSIALNSVSTSVSCVGGLSVLNTVKQF
jgi:hypothetical protein